MAALVNLLLAGVDLVLVSSLLVLAWCALRSEDLFRGCILFIVFGMVMALVWVRLRAPDVALAEAAIGSGITGALLLGALRRLAARATARGGDGFDEDAAAAADHD